MDTPSPGFKPARSRWIPTRKQALAAFAVAAALLLLNDTFCFESVLIPSSSMRPTILPGERIFLLKIGYGNVERFDVVVIASRKLGQRIAKRVVGLPGDRVRLEEGWKVFINGRPLDYSDERPDHNRTEAGHTIQTAGPAGPAFETRFAREDLLLGPDEYFVLGDNRFASEDSRFIGPVRRGEIQGKLGLVWYSYDREAGRLRLPRMMRALR